MCETSEIAFAICLRSSCKMPGLYTYRPYSYVTMRRILPKNRISFVIYCRNTALSQRKEGRKEGRKSLFGKVGPIT